MPIIYQDAFETGDFSKWLRALVIGGGTIAVTTEQKYGGNYSAKCISPIISTGVAARCERDLPDPLEVFARFYVYVSQGLPLPTSAYIDVLALNQESPLTSIFTLRIANSATGDVWRLRVRATDGTIVTADGTTVPLNQWICVEVRLVRAIAGLAQLYVNGVMIAQISNVNTSGLVLDRARFGLVWKPDAYTFGATLYVDECAVSTEYIGPIAPPPPPPAQYSLSINSTPIVTVPFMVNTVPYVTPTTLVLEQGTYEVTMPASHTLPGGVIYNFVQWENGSTNPIRTVDLTSDQTITATYQLYVPQYNLIIISGTGGTTDPIPGTYPYSANSTVQVTGKPDVNYKFLNWNLDGTPKTENPINVLMNANHTLIANFEYVPPPPLTATIKGYVRDTRTGQPIAGATVTTNGYADVTEITGYYELTSIPAAKYTLTVTMTSYQTKRVTVDATAGGDLPSDVNLDPQVVTAGFPWWLVGVGLSIPILGYFLTRKK